MDELPSKAKHILTLAKGAQPKAEPGARERVRVRVDAALAGAAITTHSEDAARALGKLGRGKTFLTSSKVMLASSVLLLGGGAMLLGTRTPKATPDERPTPAEVASAEVRAYTEPRSQAVVAAPEPSEAAPRDEPPVSALATAQTQAGALAKQGGDRRFALAAEMSLLSEATDALAKRDAAHARALLIEHRKRFHNAQLREERAGLWVLVRCLEEPAAALDEAATFVRKSPTSLLAMRVKRACGLDDGT